VTLQRHDNTFCLTWYRAKVLSCPPILPPPPLRPPLLPRRHPWRRALLQFLSYHAVTIRLTETNYLIWRAQLLPYLRSTKLIGYLDGSLPAPPKQVASSSEDGAANPAYQRWYDQDQQVLSGLLSSISEDILRDLIDATSSKVVWDMLQRRFASATRARTVQLRVELATTKKRDLSAADYFRKVKGLATDLAAAGAALRDDEIIAYLFAGLGSDYDPFVTSMTTKAGSLTLDEVYAHLMAFEAHQLQHQAELQLHTGSSSSAYYAGRGGAPKNRGGGRGCST
jgi:hypothetical protein